MGRDAGSQSSVRGEMMKQLDRNCYEFSSNGDHYGLVLRSGFGWVAKIWVGPATIEVKQSYKTPDAASERALELLSVLFARVKP